jgi:hypothetical protein
MTIRWNWGTGLAVVYAVFALGTLGFVVFAMEHPQPLVTPRAYDQALGHDRRLAAMANADALGSTFACDVESDGRTLGLQFPASEATRVRGTLTLYRPSDPGADRVIPLAPDDRGRQAVSLAGLPAGRWRVLLDWTADGTAYYSETDVRLR